MPVMRLLLTSAGITNPSLAIALSELLGKQFKTSHVTFIPTAANIEKGDKSWLVDDMANIKKLGFSVFDIVDIAVVPKNIWQESFTKADVFVFGGGVVAYLMKWMVKSGVANVLPSLLKTKVYVGISAGSMVTAKTLSLTSTSILYYEQTGNLNPMKGLGLVDFEIRPHLNSPNFPKVTLENLATLEKNIPYPFYATDDNTAVKVIDVRVEAVTEGAWKKFG